MSLCGEISTIQLSTEEQNIFHMPSLFILSSVVVCSVSYLLSTTQTNFNDLKQTKTIFTLAVKLDMLYICALNGNAFNTSE